MRRCSLSAFSFSFLILTLLATSACGRDESIKRSKGVIVTQDLLFATDTQISHGDVVPFSYLIAFKDDAGSPSLARSILQMQQGLQTMLQNTTQVSAQKTIARLNLTYPGHSFGQDRKVDAHPLFNSELNTPEEYTHLAEVQFVDEASAERQIKDWYAAKKIVFAEPNYKRSTQSAAEDQIIKNFKTNTTTPWLNEVSFVDTIEKIASTGAKSSPLIAVMDSGVDVQHPNLKDAIFVNEGGQNKQCTGDIYGCNTTVAKKDVLGNGDVFPTGTSAFGTACSGQGQCEHGTHVAGLIGARGSADFTGMCPYCKILVVKVVEVETTGDVETFPIKDSSILAGLAYISGFKSGGQPLVRLINASFGKFESSRSVELFIKALKNFGRGTLLVAAAGNEDTMKRQFPAGFDDVLAVSNVMSSTDEPKKSVSSNFGMWVDIAAPGDGDCSGGAEGILSTVPGGDSRCLSGTSMASPIVTGIGGLVLSLEPDLTAAELENRLIQTANPSKLYQDGINDGYRPNMKGAGLVPLLGSGVVNALTATNPTLQTSAVLIAQRPDSVRAGCGVLGGSRDGFGSSLLLIFPALVSGARFIRKFKRKVR